MNIGSYSYEEYVHLVKSFHGNLAPGLVIGGFMVDLALRELPEGELFDAMCETSVCLPDAVQILTPCTIGNGWLKIVNFGRFALALYEKNEGQGIRVYLDSARLEPWPEIKSWFFKLKSKKDQDLQILLDQIKEAGHDILSLQKVHLHPQFLKKRSLGKTAICTLCGEAYPARDGSSCLACQGETPYTEVIKMKRESNNRTGSQDIRKISFS
jgi:formylmethanofuran dehydrogenase subunit E